MFSQINNTNNTKEKYRYKHLLSQDEIHKLKLDIIEKAKFSIHIISENKGTSVDSILGFALCCDFKTAFYIKNTKENQLIIKELCENQDIQKIGYDIKKIVKSLLQLGIKIMGNLFDVQIAHYLLNPDMRHAIEIISENYLGTVIKYESDILGKGRLQKTYSDLDFQNIVDFASARALTVLSLEQVLAEEMKKSTIWDLFKKIEMPLIKVLAKMESEGINLDVKMLQLYSKQLSKELIEKQNNIYDLAGLEFNISSPKQLGEVLFDNLNLSAKPKKTKSGQYSTSEDTLEKLKSNHDIIFEILEFREIKKLLSTYIDALPKLINGLTQRIHTTFNQSVASTGRLSSANPNLQNIPIRTKRGMRIREAFVSKNENFSLLAADYSQIELRIMASLSQDPSLLDAFINGEDIHASTAAKVYRVKIDEVTREMRSKAKAVNFGIIYGISPFGLSQNIGVSRKEAKEIIDNYFTQFPKVKEYMNYTVQSAKKNEYVETLMGRRRYLKDINSSNAVVRAVAERNAINAPIQGLAADIIKKAMIDIQDELEKHNMKSKMLIQVHDELIFDMYKTEKDF